MPALPLLQPTICSRCWSVPIYTAGQSFVGATRIYTPSRRNAASRRCRAGRRLLASDVMAARSEGVDIIASGRLHVSEGSRVLLIGPNADQLLSALQGSEVHDILILDGENFGAAQQRSASTLGNERCPRHWHGSLQELPAYQGPFDAVIFSCGLDTSASPRDHLLAASLRTKPGGQVVGVSLGDTKHEQHRLVAGQIKELLTDIPLQGGSFVEDSHFILRVPPGYKLKRAPVKLWGDVARGFGRGSRKLGTPTANLPPEPLEEEIAGLPLGVYFGWARLTAEAGQPPEDSEVHGMVMNIGRNPTVQDAGSITVELHILHQFAQDFYGRPLKALVLGYLRPEMKFGTLDDLIAWIRRDTGLATAQLKAELHAPFQNDGFLSR